MRGSSYEYIEHLKKVLDAFPHGQFGQIVTMFLDAYAQESQIFVMGNGGSASTASHLACDINKGVSFGQEKRFKIICLNDSVPTMLAYANDISYEDVFLEQLKNFFRVGDVVIGISGSGNSKNVLKAVSYAAKNNGKTVGLCGFQGGKLATLVDIPLIAQSDDMQKIEDVHMVVVHMLMQRLEREGKDWRGQRSAAYAPAVLAHCRGRKLRRAKEIRGERKR